MKSSKFFKRYLKTGTLSLAFLICLAFGQLAYGSSETSGTNPEKIFEQANSAYQKGDFIKAVGLYQQLSGQGYLSGNLFYNLGNAYYKLGVKGRAILNYERAKRLIPGDADLRANLNYALAEVQEGVPDWKQDFLEFLTGMASVEDLAIFGTVWFFGLMVLVVLGIIRPAPLQNVIAGNRRKWWLGIIFACLVMFLSYFSLGILTYWDQSREQAVAIRADEVRFEPSNAATLYYHLAEGARVQVLEKKENWVKVKRIDSKRGWVNKDCLETI